MKKLILAAALSAGFILGIPVGPALAAVPANGFTAAVVASSGEMITGNINATGYDLGIYVGPGVHRVQIVGATISGANDEGIMVQDASDVLIEGSTVQGNAVDPAPSLSEVKGIAVVGSTGVIIRGNLVTKNGHGGIGVYDDGPNSPFAPTAIDQSPVASVGVVVQRNIVSNNFADCGIVVSAKNPGGGVYDTVVKDNTLTATEFPVPSGIIVAGGANGPVDVVGTVVADNRISGGLLPGISLHAFGPGTIADTMLIGNVLTGSGTGAVSQQTTGIEMFAIPDVGVISSTQILHDVVTNDYYGVYHVGDTGTQIDGLVTNNVTMAVGP